MTLTNSEGSKNHLLIAGTGRAGTSFLVQYLDAVGLDTHLSRHQAPWWSDTANAGFEDLPVVVDDDLPYVVKSPWMGQFIDQILRSDIKIDAVLIPVRDLRDAASSRCILEYSNIYSNAKWMLSMEDTWDEWGVTSGGVVYSIDPVDQERLLAVKFTRLLCALVNADVNMIFLDFPRIIEDAEYLYRKVRDYLPASVDLPAAVTAHQRIVDTGKVRVSKERQAVHDSEASVGGPRDKPNTQSQEQPQRRFDREIGRSEIDLIALRREIARSKAELRDADSAIHRYQEAESRLREAEEQTRGTEERARQAEERARQAEEQIGGAEERARRAAEQKDGAEERARQADERARQAAEQARQTAEQKGGAEERARQAEERARRAVEQTGGAVEHARQTDERYRELQAHSARLEDTIARLRRRTLKGIVRKVFATRQHS